MYTKTLTVYVRICIAVVHLKEILRTAFLKADQNSVCTNVLQSLLSIILQKTETSNSDEHKMCRSLGSLMHTCGATLMLTTMLVCGS